jgi:hypothetical protein
MRALKSLISFLCERLTERELMTTEALPQIRFAEREEDYFIGGYSDPRSPDLDRLLTEADGNVIVAARLLLDRMISGEIK